MNNTYKFTLTDSVGREIDSTNPVQMAAQLLMDGSILAIKGVGGFHLACNAENESAVTMLRQKKKRPDRPLAIMSRNIETIRQICCITHKEEELLASKGRPIVLLKKRVDSTLPGNIASGLNRLGVMLPYTIQHNLLFNENLRYLIMTSGNISGMPICYKDDEAFIRLGRVAHYFLLHSQEISTPIDDSVVRVVFEKEMVSRCGRGYAPITMQLETNSEIIALGGEQKATVCLLNKGYAHISRYLGNLDDMNACGQYINYINKMKLYHMALPYVMYLMTKSIET